MFGNGRDFAIESKNIRLYLESINDKTSHKEIYFLRKSSNGAKVVIAVNRDDGGIRYIKKESLPVLNLNIHSLPCYTEYRKKRAKILCELRELYSSYSRPQRDEIKECIDNKKRPVYEKRRALYDSYIGSPEWSAKRQKCLYHHGTNCIDCGAMYQEIHHTTYKNFGDEDAFTELVPLCCKCHDERHKNEVVK